MNIELLGIGIAKKIFQLQGVNSKGRAALKKRISHDKFPAYIANLPACTIAIDSCSGSNYCARVFQKSGHNVNFISSHFVNPSAKTNKNDANDAEAITKADNRPSMNFVPIKQVGQHDIQSLHRIRSKIVKNRITLINEVRAIMFGIWYYNPSWS